MDTIEHMAKSTEDIDKCFEAIAKRAECLLVADYADTLSKTVINKWDGAKLISSIEL